MFFGVGSFPIRGCDGTMILPFSYPCRVDLVEGNKKTRVADPVQFFRTSFTNPVFPGLEIIQMEIRYIHGSNAKPKNIWLYPVNLCANSRVVFDSLIENIPFIIG